MSDKFERLKNEKERLGIVKKVKNEITDVEIERWQKGIREQFAALRYEVDFGKKYEPVEPLNVYVKPDPNNKCSFLLQPFLDSLFDKDIEASAFDKKKKKDFNSCREVLFGDILSIVDAKEHKEDTSKPNPSNLISSALKSKWNVVFTKSESYGRSKKAKGDIH